MKHGVYIEEHKHWNTKKIYANGFLVRTYRRVPKIIEFYSPMVNDANQDLCGSWFMDDRMAAGVNKDIMQRLIDDLKPLGQIGAHSKSEATTVLRHLKHAGLITHLQKNPFIREMWEVTACQDMAVGDIGDMNALMRDYAQITDEMYPGWDEEIFDDIMENSQRDLSDFLEEWDSPPQPLWLTGLILGYPIENTISLYRS